MAKKLPRKAYRPRQMVGMGGIVDPNAVHVGDSAAGGDLAGTYPAPTLAVIGAAAGPIGDATHVAQVTIDTKGRVTGLSSVLISGVAGVPGKRGPPILPDDPDPGDIGPPGRSRPGTPGSTGSTGKRGPPGFAEDAPDDVPVIRGRPGTNGTPGAAGARGRIGVALDGEPGEDAPIIRGSRGLRGLRGLRGIPMDPDDPELPMVTPGRRGATGSTGVGGKRGPPGSDADADDAYYAQRPGSDNARTARGAWSFGGVISPTTVTVSQNDYSPPGFVSATIIRITTNVSGLNFTGFDASGASRGTIKIIVNANASDNFNLIGVSGSSSAGNQLLLAIGTGGGTGDVQLRAGDFAVIEYDDITAKWRGVAKWLPPPHGQTHESGQSDAISEYVGCTGIAPGVPGTVPSADAKMQNYTLSGNATWREGGIVDRIPNLSWTLAAGCGFYSPDDYEIGATIDVEVSATAVLEIG